MTSLPRGAFTQPGFPPGGVFEAALDAVIVIDHHGVVRDWNGAAEKLFGYRRDEVLGHDLAELVIPGPLRDTHRAGLARYLETGQGRILNRRLEVSARRRDGSELAVELSVVRIPRTDPPQFAGFLRSLAARRAVASESIRLQQRLAFLAQAGLVLDQSLDYNATLRSLANLIVPDLAQLAVIDLLSERGSSELTVAASQAPELAREVEEMRARTGLELSGGHPAAVVVRSGRSMLLPSMSPAFLSSIAQSADHFGLMHRAGYHSAIVVPLVARGRTLGALSLLRMRGAPSYTREDLLLAEELARRAALAVDNARLFESTRRLARTLQQSLLPHSLPTIAGARVSARYRAAERGQDVGGDFYDVFPLDAGGWGMTIGDVCGKGAQAAALTAFARYTIRALAGADASTVLGRLNDAVIRERQSEEGRFLTALFATLAIEPDRLVIELAGGGHPPPLVLRAGGLVETVPVAGPLIGLDRQAEFPATRTVLRRGDTMVLYTDGLTDARAPGRILTEADLAEMLRSAGGSKGPALAALLERQSVGPHEPRDDIALLVLDFLGHADSAELAAPQDR